MKCSVLNNIIGRRKKLHYSDKEESVESYILSLYDYLNNPLNQKCLKLICLEKSSSVARLPFNVYVCVCVEGSCQTLIKTEH